ncbi:Hypothetical predicted protein [Xyrichtys novacula]|uniref:Uncharacterized protein n=1 Tax=Xyrichtys novacula TaxID=13765 RepID=A0AAV1F9Q3_XYRNO|nr:Hypothetical predicted protein [Xyrichtys novacula]
MSGRPVAEGVGDRICQQGELWGGPVSSGCTTEGEGGCGGEVNSQSHGKQCTVCCRLAASMRLPVVFGWIPSDLKRDERFQKRLKLSTKAKLWAWQADWSQVCKLSTLLKPTTRSGNGTADKNRQFTVLQKVKKLGKMVLRELGLVEGRVISTAMDYDSLDGSWERF